MGSDMGVLIAMVIVLALGLLLGKLGDIAMDKGYFWIFLALTVLGTGLMVAWLGAVKQTYHGP